MLLDRMLLFGCLDHRPINILYRCRTSYAWWIISCSHR